MSKGNERSQLDYKDFKICIIGLKHVTKINGCWNYQMICDIMGY